MSQELVVNLKLSKELKKIGFPQETIFVWVNSSHGNSFEGETTWKNDKKWILTQYIPQEWDIIDKKRRPRFKSVDDLKKNYEEEKQKLKNIQWCSAPMAGELGKWLPDILGEVEDPHHRDLRIIKECTGDWCVQYHRCGNGAQAEGFIEFIEDNEANARAKILIHLVKYGLYVPDWKK